MKSGERKTQNTPLEGGSSDLGVSIPLMAWGDFPGHALWPSLEGAHYSSASLLVSAIVKGSELGSATFLLSEKGRICSQRAEPQSSVTGPAGGKYGNQRGTSFP